jgi:hypothetical protein
MMVAIFFPVGSALFCVFGLLPRLEDLGVFFLLAVLRFTFRHRRQSGHLIQTITRAKTTSPWP